MITITDLDSGKTATAQATSGGKPYGDPVPVGRYEILERAGRDGFYRLDKLDNNPRDDVDDDTGRDALRLHFPGPTIGCIAACNDEGWSDIDSVLKEIKTTTVKDKFRNAWLRRLPRWFPGAGESNQDIERFGVLEVIQSDPSKNIPPTCPEE